MLDVKTTEKIFVNNVLELANALNSKNLIAVDSLVKCFYI